MDNAFYQLITRFVADNTPAVFKDPRNCRALLGDYSRGEYKREIGLLMLAVEGGFPQRIQAAQDIESAGLQLVQQMQDDHAITEQAARDVVGLLLMVLRSARLPEVPKPVVPPQPVVSLPPRPAVVSPQPLKPVAPPPPLAPPPQPIKQPQKPTVDVKNYIARGNMYLDNGNWAEAIADYTEVLKMMPDSVEILENRASAYYAVSNCDAALADCEAALILDPQSWKAINTRGRVHTYLGNWAQAQADFELALLISPDNEVVFENRNGLFALKAQKAARDRKSVTIAVIILLVGIGGFWLYTKGGWFLIILVVLGLLYLVGKIIAG